MAKDMIWHELYDSMEENCCPVCALIKKRMEQAMERFLFDSVNDRGLRQKIAKAHGFCNFHAHQLKEKGDPLAHAILYSDFIEQLQRELETGKSKDLKAYSERKGCFFCENSHSGEESYLPVMIEGLADKEFFAKYESSGLLCAVHTAMIFEKCRRKKELKEAMLKVHQKKYGHILEVLSEIKRKHDYQNQHEPWTEEEKRMWKEVVSVLNETIGIRK